MFFAMRNIQFNNHFEHKWARESLQSLVYFTFGYSDLLFAINSDSGVVISNYS